MGASATPSHDVCREYAKDHFAARQSARLTQEIRDHLPWNKGRFELLGPTDFELRPVCTPEELGWSQNPELLPSSWLYPTDVLIARLRDRIGHSSHWLVFDDGVSEPSDVAVYDLENIAVSLPAAGGVVLGADASVTDGELLKLLQLVSAAWGLVLLIGRNPMPTHIAECVIRDRVEFLTIIAHDGDAFLLWQRIH